MKPVIRAEIAHPIFGYSQLFVQHKITLRNRNDASFHMGDDEAIIDAAERHGHILPIACRYGGCITCAGKLISGRVRQPNGTALNKRQSKLGFILLCVAQPKTDCVLDVGVESHDGLYQNPFSVMPKSAVLKS